MNRVNWNAPDVCLKFLQICFWFPGQMSALQAFWISWSVIPLRTKGHEEKRVLFLITVSYNNLPFCVYFYSELCKFLLNIKMHLDGLWTVTVISQLIRFYSQKYKKKWYNWKNTRHYSICKYFCNHKTYWHGGIKWKRVLY